MFCLALVFGCDGDKNDPVFVSDADVGMVNFIADVQPIVQTNCLGCHSFSISGGDRNGAPVAINFDTYENVVSNADRANARIQSGTMPPGGGIPETDRAILSEWVISGMSRESDSTGEYVATAESFKDYKTWSIADNTIFPTNLDLLGTAHQANDSDYTRWIYANLAETVNGKYPTGTIFLKETFTWVNNQKQYAASGGILAMVKRGNDFNIDAGGWEWFELNPDTLEIAGRGGGEMMDGMCNACHAKATDPSVGEDHVFTHPSQYVATAEDFSEFTAWPVSGEESGASDMLGTAHNPPAVRRVYRRQLQANPDTVLFAYPVGTTIVKQVTDGAQVVEITAMVKRGDEFDPVNGNWEWFMLNPADLTIAGRGADLMDGMCRSCHSQANTPGTGVDFVFGHADDPYNNLATTYTKNILPQIFQPNCLVCHSSILESGSARNFAPVSVNFDTYTDAVTSSQRANQRVQAGTMPPSGGLSQSEMDLFGKWLDAGAPE
jgi:mono/diheme cytochrome c family protein